VDSGDTQIGEALVRALPVLRQVERYESAALILVGKKSGGTPA
jgi:hypothetical protein